jgi:hypothetical protein
MKKRAVAGLVAALVALGCGGPSTPMASPSTDPQSHVATPPSIAGGRPSPGCGGFHLSVVNETPATVEATLNGEAVAEILAGDTVDIAEFGTLHVPPMPWHVVVRAPGSGVTLAVRDVTSGGTSTRLTLRVTQAGATAAEVAGC